MKQRVQYHKRQRGEKSQMTDDRIKLLEGIDFNWVGAGKTKNKKDGGPGEDEASAKDLGLPDSLKPDEGVEGEDQQADVTAVAL